MHMVKYLLINAVKYAVFKGTKFSLCKFGKPGSDFPKVIKAAYGKVIKYYKFCKTEMAGGYGRAVNFKRHFKIMVE
jgi:hypothetical protein